MMKSNKSKIGTLAAKILSQETYKNENIVKVQIEEPFEKNPFPNAKNFMRKTKDKTNVFHHIGIYSFKRNSLEKFVSLPMSLREKNEKLEQLRALDNNMKIKVGVIDFLPIGIDTPEDLENIKLTFK